MAFWYFLNDAERNVLSTVHGLTAGRIAALTTVPDDGSKPPTASEVLTPEIAATISEVSERRPFEKFFHTTAGDVVVEGLVPEKRLQLGGEFRTCFLPGCVSTAHTQCTHPPTASCVHSSH